MSIGNWRYVARGHFGMASGGTFERIDYDVLSKGYSIV
jgi:hypothetical protein